MLSVLQPGSGETQARQGLHDLEACRRFIVPNFLGDNGCLPPCIVVLLAAEIPCFFSHPKVHIAFIALDTPLFGGADFTPSLGLH